MRIAFGGFHIESSTYNPVLSRTEDFTVYRGEALLDAPAFRFLADYEATFLPTLHARAVPGGPIARETYEGFKREFLERLAVLGPIDGLYLALHGAAFVEGMEDAEGDFVTAARAALVRLASIARRALRQASLGDIRRAAIMRSAAVRQPSSRSRWPSQLRRTVSACAGVAWPLVSTSTRMA